MSEGVRMVESTAFHCETANMTSCMPQLSQTGCTDRNPSSLQVDTMTLAESHGSLTGCSVVVCVVLAQFLRESTLTLV